jgi:prepilin-type N-terminal cleavage/methylation domain-containing protein
MKRREGFTLVEIMVVIGIMALLASMLLGGLKAANSKEKKTEARNAVDQIVTAWKVYYADYKHFPDTGNGTSYKITEMGQDAIRILQGNYAGDSWNEKNPRKTVYIDFHGLYTDQPDFTGFLDPWGNIYQVTLDEVPYDGKITVTESVNGSQQIVEKRLIAAVWSMGPDGINGTADDVHSWDKR